MVALRLRRLERENMFIDITNLLLKARWNTFRLHRRSHCIDYFVSYVVFTSLVIPMSSLFSYFVFQPQYTEFPLTTSWNDIFTLSGTLNSLWGWTSNLDQVKDCERLAPLWVFYEQILSHFYRPHGHHLGRKGDRLRLSERVSTDCVVV